MQLGRLRIYQAPTAEAPARQPLSSPADAVSVTLDEVLPILAEALQHNRAWLKDFAREPMSISQDLYDVVMAYDRYTKQADE